MNNATALADWQWLMPISNHPYIVLSKSSLPHSLKAWRCNIFKLPNTQGANTYETLHLNQPRYEY